MVCAKEATAHGQKVIKRVVSLSWVEGGFLAFSPFRPVFDGDSSYAMTPDPAFTQGAVSDAKKMFATVRLGVCAVRPVPMCCP